MTTRNALVRLLGAAAGSPAEAVADDAPGYAVEDYAYPDADKILAEQDIVLKRGLSPSKTLTDWHQKVVDGAVERANGSIVIYDSTDAEVDRWNFERGWPSKWSASDLSADTDDVMIEELTISHEFLTRA